jgi:hypothetical protein
MTTTTERAPAGAQLRPLTLRSALKRALLGIAILAVAMGSVAWLTYASIEPASEREQPKAAKPGKPPVTPVRL